PVTDLRLSAQQARNLMLAAMGLHRRPRKRATRADVLATIRRMGVLQIDTISVVARSPYLVLWTRLGAYEPRWLDELLAEGALFEYWSHEASFLPVEDYPLYRRRMANARNMGWKYAKALVDSDPEAVPRLLEYVRENGPVRSADFERADGGKGGWWGWKPEKRLLESLLTSGELMIARRQGFQRVYDLRERVLPGWDAAPAPSAREITRTLALKAVRALGIARAAWVPDYFRTAKADTRAAVHALADEGLLLRVAVDGWKDEGYVHPDRAGLLAEAAAGEIRPTLTTVLSPFDPLVWDRARASEAFGFDYRIECYTPEAKRRYGYFVLPILRRGALVGRLDAKAHRREGTFQVKALYLEPGIRPSAALARDVAGAIAECAAWHGTPRVQIDRAEPEVFRAAVQAFLSDQDSPAPVAADGAEDRSRFALRQWLRPPPHAEPRESNEPAPPRVR
ncbi:MAG TPA: crosslink repair DNA glycosylase YcaQ family protein, partial [Longimicrobiaceae bacterium]|nr:crosslink repair DNA glycosylase YcaQ family protein [Longimicrobiaceae bacterium]